MNAIKKGIYSLKVIFRYAALWGSLYLLIMILSAGLSTVRIYFMERLIDSLAGSAGEYTGIIIFGVLLVLSIILGNLFSLLSGFMMTMISSELNKKQIPVTLTKFRNIKYECFENKDNQDMLQKISENPQSAVLSVFGVMISVIYSVIGTAGILAMFSRASYLLGAVAVITMIPMFILESTAANKEMKLRWNMTTDIRKRFYLQKLFVDKNALQEIKLFDAKKELIAKSDELTMRINRDMEKTLKKVLFLSSGSSVFIIIFTAATLAFLSVMLVKGSITLGVFVSLVTSLTSFYGLVRGLVSQVANYLRLSYGIGYYQDFLALPERRLQSGAAHDIKGDEIRFEHVDFRYPTGTADVLRDVNMKIDKGERVAFVGENGAGKSTMIKLLLGLYEPTAGHIYIDGVDIRELSDEERRKVFSVIFQDYQSYQLSLRENVALGDISKLHDDAKIKAALDDAGIGELPKTNDRGLDLNLGKIYSDGIDVSGGQWQRIAMARSYILDARFVIMDEPTAALDPIAESKMYERFADVLSKRGAIMISHRLASAKMADKIFVLSGGTVAEEGTHEELLKKGGLYHEMWEKQSSWYTEKEA